MSSDKLPPGPYRYSSIPVAILDAKGDVVAKIDTNRYDNWDDVAALGHLLAAAFEMREALERMVECFTTGTLDWAAKYGPHANRDEADNAAVEKAIAALSKSRGEGG